MSRSPGFTAAVAISFGLGIGANTALFSVGEELLRKPLPVPRPAELRIAMKDEGSLSYPLYRALEPQAVFSAMTAAGGSNLLYDARIDSYDSPAAARVQETTWNYFEALGVRIAAGRGFTRDAEATVTAEAVVSHGFWLRYLRGEAGALGAIIRIEGVPYTIVGAAERGFRGDAPGSPADVWTTILPERRAKNQNFLKVYGRVRPGVSNQQASDDLSRLFREFSRDAKARMTVNDGSRGWLGVGRLVEKPLTLLTWMAGLLLALACLNVANLLLARGASRSREILARLALGCGRWRLARQLLTESLLLAGIGALAGLAIAAVGAPALGQLLVYGNQDLSAEPGVDWRVLGFAALCAVACAALAGAAPAWTAARSSLAAGSRSGGSNPAWGRALLVAQVALSMVLVTGAVLLGRGLIKLTSVDTGFEEARAIVAEVHSFNTLKKVMPREKALDLLAKLRALPGVESASLSLFAPMTRSTNTTNFQADGRRVNLRGFYPTPDYFRTLGLAIVRGRGFTLADDAAKENTILLSVSAAKALFGSEDCTGKTVRPWKGGDNWGQPREVVGIVEDARFDGWRREPARAFYEPLFGAAYGFLSVELRAASPFAALAPEIRKTLEAEGVPVRSIRTLRQQAERAAAADFAVTRLATLLALLALVVAAVGVHAVMAHGVSRRTHEIGVRKAIGAESRSVLLGLIRDAAMVAAAGAAVGIPAAVFCSKWISSFLFGMEPTDPWSYAAAGLLLIACAAAAALGPATRAARVDPATALRSE